MKREPTIINLLNRKGLNFLLLSFAFSAVLLHSSDIGYRIDHLSTRSEEWHFGSVLLLMLRWHHFSYPNPALISFVCGAAFSGCTFILKLCAKPLHNIDIETHLTILMMIFLYYTLAFHRLWVPT